MPGDSGRSESPGYLLAQVGRAESVGGCVTGLRARSHQVAQGERLSDLPRKYSTRICRFMQNLCPQDLNPTQFYYLVLELTASASSVSSPSFYLNPNPIPPLVNSFFLGSLSEKSSLCQLREKKKVQHESCESSFIWCL